MSIAAQTAEAILFGGGNDEDDDDDDDRKYAGFQYYIN
jgi:hypothetical protein